MEMQRKTKPDVVKALIAKAKANVVKAPYVEVFKNPIEFDYYEHSDGIDHEDDDGDDDDDGGNGLHAITRQMMDLGLFKGASVGQGMLRCFYLVSGLKINVHKSNIIGVNVPNHVTDVMAMNVGCCVASFPWQYLGVPVGCNMSWCANWIPIIQKFSSKLAHWEARLLSVGGSDIC
nr:RNA-directed DNA polymerase, eukaryota [Tanacetum cinerariifolium]